ncbi:MAG: hypothetical protein ABEJ05_10915 [Haloglomus sp.]
MSGGSRSLVLSSVRGDGRAGSEVLALSWDNLGDRDSFEALALSHDDTSGDTEDSFEALALSQNNHDDRDSFEALALSTVCQSKL